MRKCETEQSEPTVNASEGGKNESTNTKRRSESEEANSQVPAEANKSEKIRTFKPNGPRPNQGQGESTSGLFHSNDEGTKSPRADRHDVRTRTEPCVIRGEQTRCIYIKQ